MPGVVCDLGVAARAIRNNRILLVQEAGGSYKGKWSLPKGSVDAGESPESAVLRELTEETGASGEIVGLAAVRSTLYKELPAVFLCYDVQINDGQNEFDTNEISEVKWVCLEELRTLDWVSDTMHNLAIDALSGNRMSIQSYKPLSKNGKKYSVYSVNKHSEIIP